MCLNKKEMDESRRKFVDKKENSQLVSVNFQLGFVEEKLIVMESAIFIRIM